MRTILVLSDFSHKANHAAEYAMEIAAHANAKVVLFNSFFVPQTVAAEAGVNLYFESYSQLERNSIQLLTDAAGRLEKKFKERYNRAPAVEIKARSGDIAGNVHHLTRNQKYWLVVLSDKADDSAVSRFIFGSNSSAIIDNCNAPVLMVPQKAHLGKIKKIAFATDLDESEMKAMHFLRELAAVWSSRIDVVHVCREKLLVTEKVDNYDTYKKITTKLDSPDVSYMDMREENICDGLDKYVAEYHVDLLAMFHKKRTLIKKLLHQSICKGMMNYHKVPLLILPEH